MCRSTAPRSRWRWWSGGWKNTNSKKSRGCIKVKPKQIVEIGPFKIEFIHVTHSIVSAVALAITTPLGVIIHTGDFKVDPTPTDNELFDLHTLADYGKRGVLLLLSDSTNADRPGYTESERAVRPRMEEIFNRAEKPRGGLLLQLFDSPHSAGARSGAGVRPARGGDRPQHGVASPRSRIRWGCSTFPTAFCCARRTRWTSPPEKVAVLISGTQGEPMSALSRVAVDNHKHISVEAGRHGGAELAHHPGQREGDLPHDRPHGAARRGRACTAA